MAATAAAKLLNVESATVFHHSACAPTFSARGHNSIYFGKLETDSPAKVSGTTIHHTTPNIDTSAAATSSQYSGARHERRNVSSSSLTSRYTAFATLGGSLPTARFAAAVMLARKRSLVRFELDPDAAANYIRRPWTESRPYPD
jgi:hypothetical protein